MVRRTAIAVMFLATVAAPALAQDRDVGQRVDVLEKQMKAVQRKVFPGGDPRFFEAEIQPQAQPAPTPGVPASTPLSDLSARVDSLEHQMTTLTGQVEQNGYKIRQLEEQLAKFRGDAEFRLNTLEGHPEGAPANGGVPANSPFGVGPSVPPGGAKVPPADSAKPAGPAAAPAANGDQAEADYLAAYALVEQKKFPEAEAALKAVVTKYPKHRRASYAQHWLGRSYLAEGKPALAAEALYANYQNNPRGERAPDSLYWLGQSLMKLDKPSEACRVYSELTDVYGAKMSASLKDQTAKARAAAKCTS